MYIKFVLTVIETPTFRRTAAAFWSDADVAEFVDFIAEHPEAGDVIPGTRALRKVRWSRPGMGKRGAARVVYFVRGEARSGRRVGTDRGVRQGQYRQATGGLFEALEGAVRCLTPPLNS